MMLKTGEGEGKLVDRKDGTEASPVWEGTSETILNMLRHRQGTVGSLHWTTAVLGLLKGAVNRSIRHGSEAHCPM